MTLALLSLVLTGTGSFLAKMATHAGQSGLATTIIIFSMDVVIACALIAFKRPEFNLSPAALGYALAGGVITGLGFLCFIVSLEKPGSQAGIASGLMNANFVIVALLSWIFLQDALSLKQVAGLAAILGGIALLL